MPKDKPGQQRKQGKIGAPSALPAALLTTCCCRCTHPEYDPNTFAGAADGAIQAQQACRDSCSRYIPEPAGLECVGTGANLPRSYCSVPGTVPQRPRQLRSPGRGLSERQSRQLCLPACRGSRKCLLPCTPGLHPCLLDHGHKAYGPKTGRNTVAQHSGLQLHTTRLMTQ